MTLIALIEWKTDPKLRCGAETLNEVQNILFNSSLLKKKSYVDVSIMYLPKQSLCSCLDIQLGLWVITELFQQDVSPHISHQHP